PGVNKPLSIAYGTGELPAMIASSRDFHAYRAQAHLPGGLIPVVRTNHFTILDELRLPNNSLTRASLEMIATKPVELALSSSANRSFESLFRAQSARPCSHSDFTRS